MKKKISLWIILQLMVVSLLAGNKHYTVIVSLDGFRWDYPEMYDTPFLNWMARKGTSATMIPSFPTKTFPNHYTIATGLYPDHHGLVANSFWDNQKQVRYSMGNDNTRNDPDFYGGEPIWITAQKQGVKTGNIYWVASDIAIQGQHPTYYRVYNKTPRLSRAERIAAAINLLKLPEKDRPQLVMLYLEEPDHSGHIFGPHSRQVKECIRELDAWVKALWEGLRQLPFAEDINLIVTSDHGMAAIHADRCVSITEHLDPSWVRAIEGDLPAQIYAEEGCVDKIYQAIKNLDHIRVWKKADIPAYLHYGTHQRVGDIVALGDVGWLVTDKPVRSKGAHGFDPTYDDMQVMFRAMGPDFKIGYKAPKFPNVSIYSLLAHLLQITPAKTDGCLDDVRNMLNK